MGNISIVEKSVEDKSNGMNVNNHTSFTATIPLRMPPSSFNLLKITLQGRNDGTKDSALCREQIYPGRMASTFLVSGVVDETFFFVRNPQTLTLSANKPFHDPNYRNEETKATTEQLSSTYTHKKPQASKSRNSTHRKQ